MIILPAILCLHSLVFFFFNDTATTEIYTLSLHTLFRSVPSSGGTAVAFGHEPGRQGARSRRLPIAAGIRRSEEHTSELQSRGHLVCRLLLEKKKTGKTTRRSVS